jgi:hypothetical protein
MKMIRPAPCFASLVCLRVVAISLASVLVAFLLSSCGQNPSATPVGSNDPHLTTNGSVEITAKLVEIPEGAIFKRDLYDYATVLKYQVLKVHRGKVDGDTLYVGHYNPWKPRAEAADKRAPKVGGNVRQFEAGQTHRMALEVPIEDYFMGGIVNKYFGKTTNTIYWAVWTNGK